MVQFDLSIHYFFYLSLELNSYLIIDQILIFHFVYFITNNLVKIFKSEVCFFFL